MRLALVIGAIALVAGCATSLPVARGAGPAIKLSEDGLGLTESELRIDFGRAQAGVISAVSALQGAAPRSTSTNTECGAGTVFAATWDNGLTLNFLGGKFLGWVVQSPFEATYPAGSVALGTAANALGSAVTPQQTSLGQEFIASGLWHLIDDERAQVTTIRAGLTCFFR